MSFWYQLLRKQARHDELAKGFNTKLTDKERKNLRNRRKRARKEGKSEKWIMQNQPQ